MCESDRTFVLSLSLQVHLALSYSANAMTVSWTCDAPTGVKFGTNASQLSSTVVLPESSLSYTTRTIPRTETTWVDYTSGVINHATIPGLDANTKYYYQVRTQVLHSTVGVCFLATPYYLHATAVRWRLVCEKKITSGWICLRVAVVVWHMQRAKCERLLCHIVPCVRAHVWLTLPDCADQQPEQLASGGHPIRCLLVHHAACCWRPGEANLT